LDQSLLKSPMDEDLLALMAADLAEIERTHMPFGKFGPDAYPPNGIPIFDLPAEYLGWFAQKGWPRGRLGDLLRMVYQMKVDGTDTAFDEMRRRAGGRTPLRPKKISVSIRPDRNEK
jgi:uncharacterized protein (DUF3820 family)